MKQFILLFIFCTSSFFVFGQEYQSDYWNNANEAFKNGNYDKAIKDYRSYIALGGFHNAEFITKAEQCKTLLSNANVLFDAGNYSVAVAKYQELLKLNPNDRDAQKRIAECNSLKPKTKGEQRLPNSKRSTTNFAFGIKGGMNLSSIINNMTDADFTPKLKLGFHAGILLDMRFGGKTGFWGLQPELLYSNQGAVINGNAITFNYVAIPLMIKLNFGKSASKGNFNFELGPYFSYLITAIPNSTIITEENSKEVEINLLDLENGKDIGIAVGMGYDFKSGLTIGARYNQGLSDMANNLQWKNSIISISLGFKF